MSKVALPVFGLQHLVNINSKESLGFFCNCPADLRVLIFSKLSIPEILNTATVSKGIYVLANNQILWKLKYKKRFGPKPNMPKKDMNWKLLYQTDYQIEKQKHQRMKSLLQKTGIIEGEAIEEYVQSFITHKIHNEALLIKMNHADLFERIGVINNVHKNAIFYLINNLRLERQRKKRLKSRLATSTTFASTLQ